VYLTYNGDQRIGACGGQACFFALPIRNVIGKPLLRGRVLVPGGGGHGFPADLTGFRSGILNALDAYPEDGDIGLAKTSSASARFLDDQRLEVDSMQIGFSERTCSGLDGPVQDGLDATVGGDEVEQVNDERWAW